MKAVLKPWIDKSKPVKVIYEDSQVESLGYLTTEQQVSRLIDAGEILFNFRQRQNIAYADSFIDDDEDYYGEQIDGLSALNELDRYQAEKASQMHEKASVEASETKVEEKPQPTEKESNIHDS